MRNRASVSVFEQRLGCTDTDVYRDKLHANYNASPSNPALIFLPKGDMAPEQLGSHTGRTHKVRVAG